MDIRPVKGEDLDSIVLSVYATFGRQTPYSSPEECYYSLLPAFTAGPLAAYVDGKLAGFTLYQTLEGDEQHYILEQALRSLPKVKRGKKPGLWLLSRARVTEAYGSSITEARHGDLLKVATIVRPEHRRKGIGLALTKELCSPGTQVFTYCLEGAGSKEMNLAAGFEPILYLERFYDSGENATLMGWH